MTVRGEAREASRGSAIRLGAEALCRLLGLATFLLVAVSLGPSGLGAYAVLAGGALLLAQLADLGLQGIACRALVARTLSVSALLRAKGLLAGATLGGAATLAWWASALPELLIARLPARISDALRAAEAPRTLAVLLAAYTAAGFVEFLGVVLRARRRPAGEGFLLVGLRASALVAVWLALRGGAGLAGIATAELVAALPWLAVGGLLAWRTPDEEGTASSTRVADALRAGAPLAVNNALAILSLKLELGVLFFLRGPAEAGAFAVALRAVEALLAVPGALCAGALPALTREALGGTSEDARGRMARTVLAIALPAAAGLALGAPLVVAVLGPGYAAASGVLRVLALSVVVLFLNTLLLHALIAAGRADLVPRITAARLLLAALLAPPLVAGFGAVGAGAGFLAAEWLLFVLARRAGRQAGFPVRIGGRGANLVPVFRADRLGVEEVRP